MTKNNKKYGFSLAESIISMMILALVIMLTLSVITRKKTTPTNKTTISGMYACWNDGTTNHQQTYDGHALKSSDNPSTCTFEMDRRAYKYYVYAVGRRAEYSGKRIDGQVVQEIIPTPTGENENEMELKIELGGSKNGGTTTIKQNGNIVVQALGGIRWTKSGLVDGNIKTCKMIDNTNPCESNQLPKCEIQNSKSQAYQNDGINPYKTSIIVNCLKGSLTLDTKQYLLEDLEKINSSVYYKRGGPKFSIQEIDSSLKTEKYNTGTKNSEFVKYLKMIPQNIQNGLTDTLLKYYQNGNGDKNGVVLIIW